MHDGIVKRRVAEIIMRLNVRFTARQLVHDGQLALEDGKVKRCPAVTAFRLNVRSTIQQLNDNMHVTLHGGHGKRRPAVIVFRFNFRAMIQQLHDNEQVAILVGPVKRRLAVTKGGVHVSSNTGTLFSLAATNSNAGKIEAEEMRQLKINRRLRKKQ
jgi:hypothetical protein